MQAKYTPSLLPAGIGGSFTHTSYAGRMRKPAELLLVPMIDIFTVLVTFLLMTAVFSRITILQLDLPSSTANAGNDTPTFRLEVIVRKSGFELTNGKDQIAVLPKVNDQYDFKSLSQRALSLKREHPDVDDASVLLERDIPYDYMIQTMDAIRSTEAAEDIAASSSAQEPQSAPSDTQKSADGELKRVALFAHIAIGEAP